MPGLPLKSEYGPTLGQLLAPRWRRASWVVRALAVAAGVVLAAALAGAVARFTSPTVSYAGAVRFSFSYGGLARTSPAAGGYARVRRLQDGRLRDSFAVGPLTLPPYRGELGAELALYAARYVRALAGTLRGFELRGEGRTQIDAVSSYAVYNVFYTAAVQGREMYGRNVLLLPERAGARRGVEIAMLTLAAGDRQVTSPLQVGTKGALEGPLGSFALE